MYLREKKKKEKKTKKKVPNLTGPKGTKSAFQEAKLRPTAAQAKLTPGPITPAKKKFR